MADQMRRRLIEYAAPQIKAAEVSDDEWELIKSFMVRPESFQPGDIRTFKFFLAHNFVDRDTERFTVGTLGQFAKTIVGKEFLIAHSWGPPGEGKFYGAEVVTKTPEEAMGIAADHPDPDALRRQLEKIKGIDGDISFLLVKMYMLADNPWARKMDAGINTHVSIGFKAPRAVEVSDSDGALMWREYKFQGGSKQTEALEGSLVFLGSQYGASTTKSIDEGEPEMVKIKLIGKEWELSAENPAGLQAVTDAVDGELQKVAVAEGKAQQALTELSELKAALGGDAVTKEKAAEIAKMAGEYHDSLIEETLKFGTLAGLIEQEKVEERRAAMKGHTVEQIRERLEEYRKVFNKAHPQAGQLSEPDQAPAPKEAVSVPGGRSW